MRSLTLFLLAVLFLSLFGCDSLRGPRSPAVSITVTPQSSRQNPRVGSAVDFSAEATGQIETYKWNFGNGETANGPNPTHTFEERGSFTVSLTVRDNRGRTASATEPVTVRSRFTTATVTEVKIRDMPFTNDQGKDWDTSTGPDVYYRAHDPTNDDELERSRSVDNVAPSDLPIIPSDRLEVEKFTLLDLTAEHDILLWDKDRSSSDDAIGGITFTLEDQLGDYPDTVTLDRQRITIDIRIDWKQ